MGIDINQEWDKAVHDESVWLFLIKHGAGTSSKETGQDIPQHALNNDKYKQYKAIYEAYLKAKNTGNLSDFLAHGNGTSIYSLVNHVVLEYELCDELIYYSNQSYLKTLSMFDLVTDPKLRNEVSEAQIINEIKNRIPQKNTSSLTSGPFNISTHTRKLMEIANHFLNDKISDIKIESDKYILFYENGDTVDLSECIANANLAHIHFSDEEIHKKFVDFAYRKGPYDFQSPDYNNIHPTLLYAGRYVSSESFRKLDPESRKLSHLSDAEIAAINVYTTDYYDDINEFLEGKTKLNTVKELKEVLLCSLFCASGLNKTPIETYHHAYRGSSSSGENLEKKKKLANEGGLTYEKGFTSTSFGSAMNSWVESSALIFIDGILGQNISLISSQPREREILIVPTQIQYLGSYEEDEITYFLVKTVQSLCSLKPERPLQEKMENNLTADIKPEKTNLIFSKTTASNTLSESKNPDILATDKKASKSIASNTIKPKS